MFGDIDKFEKQIEQLLNEFSMEDILEMFEVTPEMCLSILLNGGHATLPPYLDNEEDDGTDK